MRPIPDNKLFGQTLFYYAQRASAARLSHDNRTWMMYEDHGRMDRNLRAILSILHVYMPISIYVVSSIDPKCCKNIHRSYGD
ncbi:hypothetical protein CANARDRAFT_27272 [[Candida] arabinofermentans NRRL YB-2248]|uniref:Uncharacterized protein n=1 Tax=[Candida] arabinofermentans NRRL YB-2248 TaxID=983967 RepID=A0A1E4T5H4_9ASCO|nr:hypothetical protein CANARDRAFT_27272 [[Candida] arabinofermentans NRRL YB-2248]